MRVGIDASNIREGGGVTHLLELLRAADPNHCGFEQVIVWGGSATLARLDVREWLTVRHDPLLDRGIAYRAYWQQRCLPRLVEDAGCDVLLAPGASAGQGSVPVVAMSRNLLPFEWREMRRFGWSAMTLKWLLLRSVQRHTFRTAAGVIFLTHYAREVVLKSTGVLPGRIAMIPHGISPRFFVAPRPPDYFSAQRPCRLLYVSLVDVYKHQWNVAEAVGRLRASGVPVVLDLVGAASRGMTRLRKTLDRVDPEGSFIHCRGAVPYETLHALYESADIGVFASSCENMPNILLEGMAAGLPMACSNMGPMPEILGTAGVYFQPDQTHSIVIALRQLIESPGRRAVLAAAAFEQAQMFSWQRCAIDTFHFLSEVCGVTAGIQSGSNDNLRSV